MPLLTAPCIFQKNWTSKSERLKQAHVPDDVVFATKPALASMMIEQNIEAGVPCRWVAADNVYGVGDIADGDLAYFTTRCPKGATMQELVNVEGTRWRIEECFETAKNEFGLDHNEARSWHGWHPHVHLVMLAYAVIASVRYQANLLKPKKTQHRTRQSLSAGPFRKSGASS